MSLYSEAPVKRSTIGEDCGRQFDQFPGDIGGIGGNLGSKSMSGSQSLVLDGERGELVKSCGRVGKKGEASEAKTIAALKSHSEAERRRRERINAHLATLRGLVPPNEKMDKATLLAEVISQVKQLQKTTTQISERFCIPLDSDEVRVEQLDEISVEGTFNFKASLCCDYRPGLLSDLKKAIGSLPLTLMRSEISTLGGRLMNVLFFTSSRRGDIGSAEDRKQLVNSVHQALSSILDKFAESTDCLPQTMYSNKRQRVSYFVSSCSSS
ncbi:unnamed protein product [Coffea canephora]|uniref:BHLH domain-containing protein n=1 Tax=Coffea canephora TaxID=49390 RepID=A0A068TLI3_COFCA|nr:unnamed protein product [Coffea canephora]